MTSEKSSSRLIRRSVLPIRTLIVFLCLPSTHKNTILLCTTVSHDQQKQNGALFTVAGRIPQPEIQWTITRTAKRMDRGFFVATKKLVVTSSKKCEKMIRRLAVVELIKRVVKFHEQIDSNVRLSRFPFVFRAFKLKIGIWIDGWRGQSSKRRVLLTFWF